LCLFCCVVVLFFFCIFFVFPTKPNKGGGVFYKNSLVFVKQTKKKKNHLLFFPPKGGGGKTKKKFWVFQPHRGCFFFFPVFGCLPQKKKTTPPRKTGGVRGPAESHKGRGYVFVCGGNGGLWGRLKFAGGCKGPRSQKKREKNPGADGGAGPPHPPKGVTHRPVCGGARARRPKRGKQHKNTWEGGPGPALAKNKKKNLGKSRENPTNSLGESPTKRGRGGESR